MASELGLELLARVSVRIDEPIETGAVPGGQRRVIPIRSGRVEGERLSGEVVTLGADWNLLRDDGTESVSARYLIRTADGALLSVLNEGVIADRAAGRIGITVLSIEAPIGSAYAWLNDAVLVGSLDVETDDEGLRIVLGYWEAVVR